MRIRRGGFAEPGERGIGVAAFPQRLALGDLLFKAIGRRSVVAGFIEDFPSHHLSRRGECANALHLHCTQDRGVRRIEIPRLLTVCINRCHRLYWFASMN